MNCFKISYWCVCFAYLILFFFGMHFTIFAQGIIVDHTCTNIIHIPESAINLAKATLHIGYGHTSHGSQLTTGMTGLIDFANNGGLGLSHSRDIFAWNNGGTNGALDLEEGDEYGDGWLDHDCGYYPNWVEETRAYLDDASHADVNVIIWSWCGEASYYEEQQMIDEYLTPMSRLESDYPKVVFVYMTGHSDGSGESGILHLRNQQIREYCITNNKVLFDFYDIECYDPEGTYFGDKNVSDDCSYSEGNWAIEWQDAHTENGDWYNCESAHSQPLNANRKAYAAWWLWARLAGWNSETGISNLRTTQPAEFKLFQNYPNPFNPTTNIQFQIREKCKVTLNIYNVQGQLVFNLTNSDYLPGNYNITFNGDDFTSGLYFYSLQAGSFMDVKKMILLE